MVVRGVYIGLASIVFGVLVWFSVAMSDQYQIAVAAPLLIDKIPEGRAIRTPVPPSIELRLRGTGWQLASLFWTRDLRLSFPVQMFRGPKRAITRSDVAERVGTRPGLQLVDMAPDSVYIELDRDATKTVPVALDCQVSFREGYGQVGPTVVTPESVTIHGAEALLKTIDAWSTIHGTFENIRSTLETDLPLAPSTTYRINFSHARVRMRLEVEPFAEKTLSSLPVDIVAAAPNRELILIPPKIDVVVRGGIKQLGGLAAGDFRVSVNYRNVLADSSGTVEADVDAPTGIQVVARRPEKLQYVVRKRL